MINLSRQQKLGDSPCLPVKTIRIKINSIMFNPKIEIHSPSLTCPLKRNYFSRESICQPFIFSISFWGGCIYICTFIYDFHLVSRSGLRGNLIKKNLKTKKYGRDVRLGNLTHMLHVWNIYLHLPYIQATCR